MKTRQFFYKKSSLGFVIFFCTLGMLFIFSHTYAWDGTDPVDPTDPCDGFEGYCHGWSDCSASCGGGTRTRECKTYSAIHMGGGSGQGGDECQGAWVTETEECNTQPCCEPDCSHADEYCSGTTYPDGCGGDCYGAKKPPKCLFPGAHCAGEVYNSNECGECVGTKEKDCSDKGDYCLGTTFDDPNGCGTCWGTKRKDCSDRWDYCSGTTFSDPNGCGTCYGAKCCPDNSGCAADTCKGDTCWDGCENIPGTKDCDDPPSICEPFTTCPAASEICKGDTCWDGCDNVPGTKDCCTPTDCEACIGDVCWNGCAYEPGTKNCGDGTDGVCGTAERNYLSTETQYSGSFCAVGTPFPAIPTFPSSGGFSSWTCLGSGDGSNVTCNVSRGVDFNCTGNRPSGTTVCPGDKIGLTSNTAWQSVGNNSSNCTAGRKCEYYSNVSTCTEGDKNCYLVNTGNVCPSDQCSGEVITKQAHCQICEDGDWKTKTPSACGASCHDETETCQCTVDQPEKHWYEVAP